MRLLFVGASVVGTLMLCQSAAADINHVLTYGVGNSSCGQWLELRKSHSEYVMSSWLSGYVTGASAYNSGKMAATDTDGLVADADQFCRAHPLDPFLDAAAIVVLHLQQAGRSHP